MDGKIGQKDIEHTDVINRKRDKDCVVNGKEKT